MESCIYAGWVMHRRHAPAPHQFRYRLFMPCLDLSELETVFVRRWLWSTRRRNLAEFRRSDHLGDPSVPLDVAVRDLVQERTGQRPQGPIRLLTQLRYWGYILNPVCFYLCFSPDETDVRAIVAEVTNTPWGERHCYVLAPELNGLPGQELVFEHRKEFHVSPFMGMDMQYRWQFTFSGESLSVRIENRQQGQRLFDATLNLKRLPLSGRNLARCLVRHPFMTGKIAASIYWQAVRLWWKKTPFHSHPMHHSKSLQQETTGH